MRMLMLLLVQAMCPEQQVDFIDQGGQVTFGLG